MTDWPASSCPLGFPISYRMRQGSIFKGPAFLRPTSLGREALQVPLLRETSGESWGEGPPGQPGHPRVNSSFLVSLVWESVSASLWGPPGPHSSLLGGSLRSRSCSNMQPSRWDGFAGRQRPPSLIALGKHPHPLGGGLGIYLPAGLSGHLSLSTHQARRGCLFSSTVPSP